MTSAIFKPCAEALDAAKPSERTEAAQSLSVIESSWPSLALAVRAWAVSSMLQDFGRCLGKRRIATLSRGAIARIRWSSRAPFSPWQTFRLKSAWHSSQARMDAFVESGTPEVFAPSAKGYSQSRHQLHLLIRAAQGASPPKGNEKDGVEVSAEGDRLTFRDPSAPLGELMIVQHAKL